MKIILSPNAFKGSLTAAQAARAMRRGLARALPRAELVEMPVADGGDGTVEVLRETAGESVSRHRVAGPLGDRVRAERIRLAGQDVPTDVIELAQTSGLVLIPPDRRNPLETTTFGLGELIDVCRRRGARRIIIGLGGSATVDGAAGLAQALGFKLLDRRGKPIPRGGGGLAKLARIVPPDDWRPRRGKTQADNAPPEIVAMCDVKNRLLGPDGAAAVFGPQKGASPAMVRRLEQGLSALAERIHRDLGREVRRLPGGGAAGGAGAGLKGFLGARMRPGAELVLDVIGFHEAVRGADCVITGEGALDLQTLEDKAPAVVARAAARAGVPTIALAGAVAPELMKKPYRRRGAAFAGCFAIAPGPLTLEESSRRAEELLELKARQIGNLLAGLLARNS